MTHSVEELASGYFGAKALVLDAGYEWELEQSADRLGRTPQETDFLREAAWVVMSSGMSAAVVADKFGLVSAAFLDWRSAETIVKFRADCVRRAMRAFAHGGKVSAIADIAEAVARDGFETLVTEWQANPIHSLSRLPYIGPITVFHLAKNLGFDVAKPDRHLQRLANVAGWDDPLMLCRRIADRIGERISVVDSVLWRYSTLVKDAPHDWLRLIEGAGPVERSCDAKLDRKQHTVGRTV